MSRKFIVEIEKDFESSVYRAVINDQDVRCEAQADSLLGVRISLREGLSVFLGNREEAWSAQFVEIFHTPKDA